MIQPRMTPSITAEPGSNAMGIAAATTAASSMIRGMYPIFVLQCRQRPQRQTQLKSGTSSDGERILPQESQAERPQRMGRLLPCRATTNPVKLPIRGEASSKTSQTGSEKTGLWSGEYKGVFCCEVGPFCRWQPIKGEFPHYDSQQGWALGNVFAGLCRRYTHAARRGAGSCGTM